MTEIEEVRRAFNLVCWMIGGLWEIVVGIFLLATCWIWFPIGMMVYSFTYDVSAPYSTGKKWWFNFMNRGSDGGE